jgi:hypothetical protein
VLLGGVSLARQDNLVVVGLRVKDEFLIAALVKFKTLACEGQELLVDDVLAPNAKLRDGIVPSPPENTTEHAADHANARMSWARLLKRVLDVDIESIRRRSVIGLNNSP